MSQLINISIISDSTAETVSTIARSIYADSRI